MNMDSRCSPGADMLTESASKQTSKVRHDKSYGEKRTEKSIRVRARLLLDSSGREVSLIG